MKKLFGTFLLSAALLSGCSSMRYADIDESPAQPQEGNATITFYRDDLNLDDKALTSVPVLLEKKNFEFEPVGILNADTMLNYPDFRAYERAFQLMAQVAGRAGRKDKRGRVVLQTKSMDHPIIAQVMANDFEGMASVQLAERQVFRYPPYYRLVYVYLKHRDEALLDTMAHVMADHLRAGLGERVLGPDKPPVARVQTLFIRKIVVKIENTVSLSRAKQWLVQVQREMQADERCKSLIVYYDVDPQ